MKKKAWIVDATLIAVFLFVLAILPKQDEYARADSPGVGDLSISFGAVVGTVQTVKGTPATFTGYEILNSAATICYLQMFNVANATTVTLGTTVPKLSLGFPIGAAGNVGALNNAFPLGIKIAATTTRTGSTPCGTGMDVNIFFR